MSEANQAALSELLKSISNTGTGVVSMAPRAAIPLAPVP